MELPQGVSCREKLIACRESFELLVYDSRQEQKMTTFALVHGGGGTAAGWDLVRDALARRGHESVAMLPCDDPSASWPEYVEAIVEAVGDRTDLVVVGHSAGGFVAPLVCERLDAKLLVLLTAMIPAPGEAFMEWWSNTRHDEANVDFSDENAIFCDGVPPELAGADAKGSAGRENFPSEAWPLERWPDVPTKSLLCRDDRLFPPEFMRRVVRERLGVVPDEIDGGHMVILSHPDELAVKLVEISE